MEHLIKVKFKPEVVEYIRNNTEYLDRWITVRACGVSYEYTKRFDVPFFIVNDNDQFSSIYYIRQPQILNCWAVRKEHVVPYEQFEIKMDDGLWEI